MEGGLRKEFMERGMPKKQTEAREKKKKGVEKPLKE